jgi:hypothetical protein
MRDKATPSNRNAVTMPKYNTLNSNSESKTAESKILYNRGDVFRKKRASLKQKPYDLYSMNNERNDRLHVVNPHSKYLARGSTKSVTNSYNNPMKAVDNVCKYINENKTVNLKNYVGSNGLKTSDGFPIRRGRIQPNISQSSQSSSKPRKRFFGSSLSVEGAKDMYKYRAESENTRIPDSSKIFVKNFLGNVQDTKDKA